jgi:hypothetical protein
MMHAIRKLLCSVFGHDPDPYLVIPGCSHLARCRCCNRVYLYSPIGIWAR